MWKPVFPVLSSLQSAAFLALGVLAEERLKKNGSQYYTTEVLVFFLFHKPFRDLLESLMHAGKGDPVFQKALAKDSSEILAAM